MSTHTLLLLALPALLLGGCVGTTETVCCRRDDGLAFVLRNLCRPEGGEVVSPVLCEDRDTVEPDPVAEGCAAYCAIADDVCVQDPACIDTCLVNGIRPPPGAFACVERSLDCISVESCWNMFAGFER